MNFEPTVHEIDDPVFRYARSRVEAALLLAVEAEPRKRYLDDQRGAARVRLPVVARIAGHDRDIGLWLGFLVERHRHLRPDVPAGSERPFENALDQSNCRGVRAVLRLFDDQLATEQLDPIIGSEDLGFRQPIVLDPRPLPRDHRLAHVCARRA